MLAVTVKSVEQLVIVELRYVSPHNPEIPIFIAEELVTVTPEILAP